MKSVSKEELQALRNSDLFDEKWYLEQYPDVKILEMDPVEHYLWLGAKLSRNPSHKFSTQKYLERHSDVREADINPLYHYVKSGRLEGRRIDPPEPKTVLDRLACNRIINRRLATWDKEAERSLLTRLDRNTERSNALISVIMPTLNRANCLSNAIRSVLDQTHAQWELIIVDDGSSDHTAEIVSGFKDARIRYLKHELSKGVSEARNTGLRQSKGDWVFFLDSDNEWKPNYLETMLRFVAYHDLRAAYCGAEIVGDGNQSKGYLFSEFDFETCVDQNFIDLNTFCVRADFAKIEFDRTLRRLVDWDYILRIAARTRVRAAQFLGVSYYDGDQHNRITRKEYRKDGQLEAIIEQVRQNARRALQAGVKVRDNRASGLAVVFHVYHPEYIDECLKFLGNVPDRFDLYVTTSLSDGHEALDKIRRKFPDAVTLQYPNVGFDIGPFLSLLPTLCNYELVCKIHSKRDVSPWGGTWRTTMLEALLGSHQLVERIIAEFQADDRLHSVGPQIFFKDARARSLPATYRRLRDLSDACGFSAAMDRPCGFFAGTAFWVRPHLLYAIARHACDHLSYSSTYSKDDLIEHALERAVGVALQTNDEPSIGLTQMQPGGRFSFEKVAGAMASPEAITVTLDRIHKAHASKPLRYFPDYTSNNAYQRLLYSEFGGYDVKPGNVDECIDLQKKTGRAILHLHWINALLGSAKSDAEAGRIATDYIAKLRQFASLGGRIVWTVHNVVSHEPRYIEQELKLSRALADLAVWIHVHHASVAEETRPYYELPRDKIVVAEHGNYIGTLPDNISRDQARSELGIPAGAKVFLFLGQIRGYKGIDELIAAFRELGSKERDCWLLMAGKLLGISESDIEKKLAGTGNVIFRPGYVPDERMQVYLKAADAMVLPYRKVLTSGSVFLAMSFGLPAICPGTGLLSHLAKDGSNALVYDAGDPRGLLNAMRRFAGASSSDIERMRAGALATAQAHCWKDTSAKLRRHFDGIDFGDPLWTEIEGSRRVWFVNGDLEALKNKRCIAIVLHYQNRDDTRQCIERLLGQGTDLGVLLLSNAETLDDIRDLSSQFPGIVSVQAEDNVGYAAANNFGLWLCRQSRAEFFWVVNPDIVVPDGYYGELVRRAEASPGHDFFGSTIVPAHQPEKVIFCGGEVRLDQGARPGHLHMGQRRSALPTAPFECDYLTGANIFGRTSALADAGFLPEHYFLYFEETDWFLAMRRKGNLKRPLVFPDMVVENFKRSEAGLVPSRYYIYYFIRNSLIFGQKYAGGQMDACVREARKFADAWLDKIGRGAPERLAEFRSLVDRAFEDGRSARTGRVTL